MRNFRVLVIPALAILTACAPLHIHKDDGAGTRVAKVAGRVPVAILTLGYSEVWHSRQRVMNSWIGHSEDELIAHWGQPTGRYEDGKGGHILVYSGTRSYVVPGAYTSTSNFSGSNYTSSGVYSPAQVQGYRAHRTFRIIDGLVYSVAWKGL